MEKCNICGAEFDNHGLYANHMRWKHKDEEYYTDFKNKMSQSTTNFYIKKFGEFDEFEVTCHKCGKSFKVKERVKRFPEKEKYFCSRGCANSRNHSDEVLLKISKGNKEKWKDETYARSCIENGMKKDRFSSKGEREIRSILKNIYGEDNVSAHRIIKLSDDIYKTVDITIKKYNTIIEYDGEWHFNEKLYKKIITKDKSFEKVIEKDRLLKDYCKINNIKLLRISDDYYKNNKDKSINQIIDFIEDTTMFKEMY